MQSVDFTVFTLKRALLSLQMSSEELANSAKVNVKVIDSYLRSVTTRPIPEPDRLAITNDIKKRGITFLPGGLSFDAPFVMKKT